jgi:hypothetical protein
LRGYSFQSNQNNLTATPIRCAQENLPLQTPYLWGFYEGGSGPSGSTYAHIAHCKLSDGELFISIRNTIYPTIVGFG